VDKPDDKVLESERGYQRDPTLQQTKRVDSMVPSLTKDGRQLTAVLKEDEGEQPDTERLMSNTKDSRERGKNRTTLNSSVNSKKLAAVNYIDSLMGEISNKINLEEELQ